MKILSLFYTINSELEKLRQWFKAMKLSVNIRKTKFTPFYNNKDKILLQLPASIIGNNNTERKCSIKLLEVMLDDYKSWIDYVRTVGNKLVKNTALLYHVSQLNYLN